MKTRIDSGSGHEPISGAAGSGVPTTGAPFCEAMKRRLEGRKFWNFYEALLGRGEELARDRGLDLTSASECALLKLVPVLFAISAHIETSGDPHRAVSDIRSVPNLDGPMIDLIAFHSLFSVREFPPRQRVPVPADQTGTDDSFLDSGGWGSVPARTGPPESIFSTV